MKDNSKYVAIILAIAAIVVIVISLTNGKDNTEKEESNPLIVTNASNFYTVNSCLYRTITYLSSKDSKNLNLLINENYKKKNKIDEKNVLEIFSNVSENSTFVSEKMYYVDITSEITKYYVEGHVEINNIMDEHEIKKENYEHMYFIVYLDTTNKLFSIEPYDGSIFKEVNENE